MDIDDPDQDLDRMKGLKVKIPLRQHIQLHTLKLLTGKNMSTTVQEVLDMYIEAFREANADETASLVEVSLGGPDGEDEEGD